MVSFMLVPSGTQKGIRKEEKMHLEKYKTAGEKYDNTEAKKKKKKHKKKGIN